MRKQCYGMEQGRAMYDEVGIFRLGWFLAMAVAAGFCWAEVIPAARRR
ncbi:hypothetical protein [Nitrospira lenta]|uniref:Uncharacterized protein n=1 Tax=Nitrospira lenta TaxID=1436998 RepID=A0A330LAK9_9BACT|nr:hypothetical protein [Nitrospira lenta]SPP66741.1 hypothetical protein NITLEN_80169 [Nitrospira lenta]